MLSSVSLNTPISCAPQACSRSMRAPKVLSLPSAPSYLTHKRLGRRTSRKLHPATAGIHARVKHEHSFRDLRILPMRGLKGPGNGGVWIVGALLLGLAVSRIGLPPLVGFLASGFVFAAFGMDGTPMLTELAHAGVLLLLFAVGLKLRIKTLLRYEVWGTATSH